MYRGDIVENGTTYFHYSLDFQPGNTITGYSILYDYTNKIWKDGDSAAPFYLHSSVPLVGTSFTIANPAHLHGFDTNSTEYFGFPNPYHEAPAYRTGTSKGFAFTSGAWKNNGYSAVLDDEANSSSGKLVNGVRQFEWDMPDIGGGRLYSGANNWIYFVPGTAEDNGTWYNSSTSTGGTAGTRNGRVISIGTSATFDETDAFVDGLVPYGDIP